MYFIPISSTCCCWVKDNERPGVVVVVIMICMTTGKKKLKSEELKNPHVIITLLSVIYLQMPLIPWFIFSVLQNYMPNIAFHGPVTYSMDSVVT